MIPKKFIYAIIICMNVVSAVLIINIIFQKYKISFFILPLKIQDVQLCLGSVRWAFKFLCKTIILQYSSPSNNQNSVGLMLLLLHPAFYQIHNFTIVCFRAYLTLSFKFSQIFDLLNNTSKSNIVQVVTFCSNDICI